MGRAPCCDKNKVKKGPWTPAEDSKLISFIHNHGHPNWRHLPKLAGLLRCGKSCRLRWINYLRPEVKRGNWTPVEEEKLISLHRSFGNKWSKIASEMPGRTDNEIKNVWNTHLKKKLIQSTDVGHDIPTHLNDSNESNIHKNMSSSEFQDSPSSPHSSITSISSCISYGNICILHDQDHPKQVVVNPHPHHQIHDLKSNQNDIIMNNNTTCNVASTSHYQKENDTSDVNLFWNTVLFTTVINDSVDGGDNILTQPWQQLDVHSQMPTDTHCSEAEGGGVDDTLEEEWLRYLEHELGLIGDDVSVSSTPLSMNTTSSSLESDN